MQWLWPNPALLHTKYTPVLYVYYTYAPILYLYYYWSLWSFSKFFLFVWFWAALGSVQILFVSSLSGITPGGLRDARNWTKVRGWSLGCCVYGVRACLTVLGQWNQSCCMQSLYSNTLSYLLSYDISSSLWLLSVQLSPTFFDFHFYTIARRVQDLSWFCAQELVLLTPAPGSSSVHVVELEIKLRGYNYKATILSLVCPSDAVIFFGSKHLGCTPECSGTTPGSEFRSHSRWWSGDHVVLGSKYRPSTCKAHAQCIDLLLWLPRKIFFYISIREKPLAPFPKRYSFLLYGTSPNQ